MFPLGEKFFVNVVHHYRNQIKNEALLADVEAFTKQEINHSKAHSYFNEQLVKLGYDIDFIEDILFRRFRKAKRMLSRKRQLAVVIAYEHFTALFGDVVLKDPRWFENVDPVYVDLLRWHAAEEIEHKSVAYNVYCEIKGDYLTRIVAMIISTFDFYKNLIGYMYLFLKHDGKHTSIKTWGSLFKFLFIRPASVFQLIPGYLRYFSPWFHPDNTDNAHLVKSWKDKYYTADSGVEQA